MGRIGNITFACEDPDRLATFDIWAAALGYDKEEAPPGILEALAAAGRDRNSAAAARDPNGAGPRLFFQKKQKSPTEVLPIHLDINAGTGRPRSSGSSGSVPRSSRSAPTRSARTPLRGPGCAIPRATASTCNSV